jgi:eukaryotic-like serine/threonine-protein kinase
MIDALPGDIFHQGQILNNTYEIEGVLGRGGTGEVYRARNQISGRIVAIKALNSRFSGNDDYIELMKREEQMRDIVDDAVVRYTECSRSDRGHVFLVMDFVDGPSMADVMARRRMESRELMIVAHRVAEGLVAAHRNGIVHRDLSPDNIILRGDHPERATIIDFGIAKDTAAGARTIVGNDFAGKYEYAAPEQLEGRAEPRSDLYALGALLLAAFRGQVPFSGATPGEMIRRKQAPLDVTGVPEPLKGLISWLSAPSLPERAPSAAAVVAKLHQSLKPESTRGRPVVAASPRAAKPGSAGKWLLLPLLLALAGGGAYFGGVFDGLFVQPLPVASPYVLTAEAAREGRPARLAGNAPDAAAQSVLAAAFAKASATNPDSAALTLADGVPSPNWLSAAAAVFEAVAGLEDWEINLSGTTASVTGLVADAGSRAAAEARLKEWAAQGGFALTLKLVTGPRLLPYEAVAEVLSKAADCGQLAQSGVPGQPYPMGATIEVSGNISNAAVATKLEADLLARIGDRFVQLNLNALNADICAVRSVLPMLPDSTLSIWLGQGATGAANLSGIYHKDDNPIVDVLAPANMTEGKLYVVVVDNTGKVFNVVPNVYSDETALAALGTTADGVRRVRVLYSYDELRQRKNLIATRVLDGDFGKSEVIAILSHDDLFDMRRPTDESIASFAAALAEVQKQRPGNIIGMASRILDARP